MTTYRELVYMVLDELKAKSDDFYYTEDHIIFLLDKYRAFLLKQKYSDIKKSIPESNFQNLQLFTGIDYIPNLLNIGIPKIKNSNNIFNYVSPNRFTYVGNSFNRNLMYFTITDNFLYFKLGSSEVMVAFTEEKLNAIFESPKEVYETQDQNVEILDCVFPLEEGLVSPLLEMVVKDLLSASLRPEDNTNNSKDDLGDLNRFMYQNSKSDLQKQIYG